VALVSVAVCYCLSKSVTVREVPGEPDAQPVAAEPPPPQEHAAPPTTDPPPCSAFGRKLSDINVSADLTEGQVIALWGPPEAHVGFAIDYRVYFLEDGRELSLEFKAREPHRLLRALIRTPGQEHAELRFTHRGARLSDRGRRLGDIKLTDDLTEKEVI